MNQLETKLDIAGEEFKANTEFMSAYVDKIRELERNSRNREETYRDRATKRGKLLPESGSPTCWTLARPSSSSLACRLWDERRHRRLDGWRQHHRRNRFREWPPRTGHGLELRDQGRHDQFCDHAKEPALARDRLRDAIADHIVERERRRQSRRRWRSRPLGSRRVPGRRPRLRAAGRTLRRGNSADHGFSRQCDGRWGLSSGPL